MQRKNEAQLVVKQKWKNLVQFQGKIGAVLRKGFYAGLGNGK